jgi:serine/threonine-protein kinase RsbT
VAALTAPIVIAVLDRNDVETARRTARSVASGMGFDRHVAESIVLTVSELATNLVKYARNGRILLEPIEGERRTGLQIESRDDGPGIADLQWAMQDRYSTGGSLGSGLPASKRLTDEFEITSDENGTWIRARVWLTARPS